MTILKKSTLLLVALLVLFSSVAMSPTATSSGNCIRRHKVAANESLETIAMKYSTTVRTLITLNKIPNEYFIFVGQKLCVAGYRSLPKGPLVLVKSVARDTSVAIRIQGFGKNEKLEVYMGTQGTQGRNGIKVATPTTDNTGAVELTVEIPAQLDGQSKLSLRVQNAKAKLVANEGFNNISSISGGYSDMPAASVTGWVYSKSVTISLVNAPAGVTYKVVLATSSQRMILHHSNSTITTGAGGALTATINLPKTIKASMLVHILLQDANTGSFAYASYTNK